MVSVEIFTLFLSGRASREEEDDGAAEDGWGAGERSEDKSKHGVGVEVRSQKNRPSPSASRCKQEIEDHRETEETGRQRGEAATAFELD